MGLLSAMYEDDADFTNTFRALGSVPSQPADSDEDGIPAPLLKVCSSARVPVVQIYVSPHLMGGELDEAALACAWCSPQLTPQQQSLRAALWFRCWLCSPERHWVQDGAW